MSFFKVRKYNVSLGDDRIGLIRVASFGAHLKHYQMELPPRLSLLKLLAKSREVIEQLENFKAHSQGSVLKGIGSLLRSAIH